MNALDSKCGIARSLGVLSDSWSFLLLREAFFGKRTFAQFRDSLGIASDVLSTRLNTLVEHGVLENGPYQEQGQRTRDAYELTLAGNELKLVLVAMQQWGDANVPGGSGVSMRPVTGVGQGRVRAAFVDSNGENVPQEDVDFVRLNDADAERASEAN
ncbi:winged helix-turn-helix transcriptional regulator [Arthrobacter psychrolactophilus]